MTKSCPVLTPSQREFVDIQSATEKHMLQQILGAIDEATQETASQLLAKGSEFSPPPRDYFNAVAHQKLFLGLCGADLDTFAGGDPKLAEAIIKNLQSLAQHYWGHTAVK